jgi:phosphatidylserine/phosphatidylglycerophosphate/cardiolipin synthase-like enzyme
MPEGFTAAARQALADLGAEGLQSLGVDLSAGVEPRDALDAITIPEVVAAARIVLEAIVVHAVDPVAAGHFLAGMAEGIESAPGGDRQVELVWSGPTSARVPVRATGQVLLEVIAATRSELLLMTYSARPYEPLLDALIAASVRGVRVMIVIETLQGAGSALQGAEPAAAFARVAGADLWHWPASMRPEGAKMHAKLVVADQSVLFTTSANLTGSGIERNIETGLLLRGGNAPRRAVQHVCELQSAGVLRRYR